MLSYLDDKMEKSKNIGNTRTQPISFTETFMSILTEFLERAGKDPLFVRSTESKQTRFGIKDKRYQKNKQNSMFSLKIRFVIAEYVRRKRQEEFNERQAQRQEVKQEEPSVQNQEIINDVQEQTDRSQESRSAESLEEEFEQYDDGQQEEQEPEQQQESRE